MLRQEGTSKNRHSRDLAEELLADIELGRLSGEAIVLKARRLARLVGSEQISEWLGYEMFGYNSGSTTALKYMGWTGRWTDQAKNLGFWGPLSVQEATITSLQLELQALRTPDVTYSVSSANPNEFVTGRPNLGAQAATGAIDRVLAQASQKANALIQYRAIRSKVIALTHSFVTNMYYELLFSGFTESIFERYKAQVDGLLAQNASDVLQKLPAVYDRLAEGDAEAVSQALTSVRRIVDSFADAVYPASKKTVESGGNVLQLGPSNHLNRINAYVIERVTSNSRRQRLRQQLSNLYERVSTGVHNDVTPQEARSLLLESYLFLGEIITLEQQVVPAELALGNQQRPRVGVTSDAGGATAHPVAASAAPDGATGMRPEEGRPAARRGPRRQRAPRGE